MLWDVEIILYDVEIISHIFEVMERIRAERIIRRSFLKDLDKISEATEINNNSGDNLEKIKSIDEKDIGNVTEEFVMDYLNTFRFSKRVSKKSHRRPLVIM